MTMKPAMDADQWDWHFTHHNPDRAEPFFDVEDYVDQPGEPHAVAALLLYKQPFGFTREDVKMLRGTITFLEQNATSSGYGDEPELRSLADRIEALLPPEG